MKKFLLLLFILPVIFFQINVISADNSINVKLVAKKHEASLDKLTDYYGVNIVCDDKNEKCVDSADRRFFIKMYDLYYLYLSKYNVKLDLPLIMSTLTYKNDDIKDVFKYNLSYYDRKTIVENDWKPSSVTELDWEYDYESSKNYLVSNDASLDMQVLAKNMVSKKTLQKCVKDGKTVQSKKVADTDDDLNCGAGETLEKGASTYELDLDKYDDFLLEFIEKKYYSKRSSDSPGYNENLQSLYVSDKVPSIIGKRKSSSKKNDSSSGEFDGEIIEKLNSIALGEVGNDHTKYSGNASNWCADFIVWLFKQVDGIDTYIKSFSGAGSIPRESVPAGYGTWYEDECYDSSTVPQAGDLILFDPYVGNGTVPWPENGNDQYYSSHIGYVYKVDDDYVYTVEGNSGGSRVNKKQYSRKYCGADKSQGINGYYRPNYIKKSSNDSSDDNKKDDYSSSSGSGATLVSSPGQFKKKIFYYNQYDYSGYSYGTDSISYGTIGSHGCGPTSLAIAISSLLQEEHSPIEMTSYVCGLGGCTDSGSAYLTIYQAAIDYGKKYGFTAEPTSDLDYIKKKLSEGKSLVVTITNGGLYTNAGNRISFGGHFFVLTGVDENGEIYISDPANSANTGRTINLAELSYNSNNSESAPSFCILTK